VNDHQRIEADFATLPLTVTVPVVCADATPAAVLSTMPRHVSFTSCLIIFLISFLLDTFAQKRFFVSSRSPSVRAKLGAVIPVGGLLWAQN
jgi:hypothetical protein